MLEADAVIISFGFRPHKIEWLVQLDVDLDSQGRIVAPEQSESALQTSNPKIFDGGEERCAFDLIVTAIAEGRKSAYGIIHYLDSVISNDIHIESCCRAIR
ncbi:MAG: hypothetical protein ACFC1C_03100 [Candidatus Malihini olakiniferum]